MLDFVSTHQGLVQGLVIVRGEGKPTEAMLETIPDELIGLHDGRGAISNRLQVLTTPFALAIDRNGLVIGKGNGISEAVLEDWFAAMLPQVREDLA